MPVLAYNKKANFDYEITCKIEAGLVLLGHEVKSIKTRHISLRGAYITIKKGKKALPELFLINAHIPLYKKASTIKDYNPTRPRKLLVHKKQIEHLIGKKKEAGLTLVPIKIYTKHSLIKLEFGIGRGRKKYDKREAIKKREVEKNVRAALKSKIINYKL